MRLIDADELRKNMFDYAPPEMKWDRGDIEHKIGKMPTIDAVPVVRCKDCSRKRYCEWYSIYGCDENNFCSWGRIDETNRR